MRTSLDWRCHSSLNQFFLWFYYIGEFFKCENFWIFFFLFFILYFWLRFFLIFLTKPTNYKLFTDFRILCCGSQIPNSCLYNSRNSKFNSYYIIFFWEQKKNKNKNKKLEKKKEREIDSGTKNRQLLYKPEPACSGILD